MGRERQKQIRRCPKIHGACEGEGDGTLIVMGAGVSAAAVAAGYAALGGCCVRVGGTDAVHFSACVAKGGTAPSS